MQFYSIDIGFPSTYVKRMKFSRTYLKNASNAQWLRYNSAQNAHVLRVRSAFEPN